MKAVALFIVAMLLPFVCLSAETRQILVTPQWLDEHIHDSDVVVLHISQSKRDYDKAHIPGARYLWIGWFAQATPYLSFELLPVAQLDSCLQSLGISNSSRIVLCGSGSNVSQVARAYITLDYLGMGEHTMILDGGLDAWKTTSRKLSSDVPTVRPTSFIPMLNTQCFVNADFVQQRLNHSSVTILDARAPEFYKGRNTGGYARAGHIPGAKNIFFATLFDSTNAYLPLDSLKNAFAAAGVKKGDEIICYCHVGQTASPLYIAARMLGYFPHLYDGSFEDWSGREDLPIVQEPKDSTK